MYTLAQADSFKFPGDVYVNEIVPVFKGVATITSDGNLSLFNPRDLKNGPLGVLPTGHGSGIKVLQAYSAQDSVVATAGEDGNVCLWDFRQASSNIARFSAKAELQSIACSSASNAIAAGTIYENHQAMVLLWDVRSPDVPVRKYTEVHSDDVTELKFHPSNRDILLSGSTDGLVNILDTAISDEDEVVIQTFNNMSSIHRAGFLNENDVFALSHDEKLAVYSLSEKRLNGSALQNFDELRNDLRCQYVANVVPQKNGAGAVIGAGTCAEQMFGLVHLNLNQSGWKLDMGSAVGLQGSHSEEVVRGFTISDELQTVLTCGEDGCVKSWTPSS